MIEAIIVLVVFIVAWFALGWIPLVLDENIMRTYVWHTRRTMFGYKRDEVDGTILLFVERYKCKGSRRTTLYTIDPYLLYVEKEHKHYMYRS